MKQRKILFLEYRAKFERVLDEEIKRLGTRLKSVMWYIIDEFLEDKWPLD
jgi:hypothetical protein